MTRSKYESEYVFSDVTLHKIKKLLNTILVSSRLHAGAVLIPCVDGNANFTKIYIWQNNKLMFMQI